MHPWHVPNKNGGRREDFYVSVRSKQNFSRIWICRCKRTFYEMVSSKMFLRNGSVDWRHTRKSTSANTRELVSVCTQIRAVFTLEDALSVQTHNASMAVFILRTHYPTGRTWANICSSSGYASLVWRRAQDALCFWTNFPSKYVLNDALRKVVRLDA